MSKTITVYTKTSCPYCELVKKYLDSKGTVYSTINMDEDTEAMQKIQQMTGQTIAPTTVVDKEDGTQEVIVGFNLGKIVPAVA